MESAREGKIFGYHIYPDELPGLLVKGASFGYAIPNN